MIWIIIPFLLLLSFLPFAIWTIGFRVPFCVAGPAMMVRVILILLIARGAIINSISF